MNVLMVNTFHYYRGGDCTYMFTLADILRSHGHGISFFGMKHPLNLPCPEERFFVEQIDYAQLNAQKNIITGFKVMSRSIYSRGARKKIAALLDEIKPDVAHVHNIHAHLTPSVLFELARRKIPVVWTLHDYKLLCPNTHFLSHGEICERCLAGRFYNCTFHTCKKESLPASVLATAEAYSHGVMNITGRVSAFVAPSRFLKSKFEEFGWETSRLSFVRNPLPKDKPNPVKNSADGGYVLYFGGLEPWKGVHTLLRSASSLRNIKFLIAGDGNQKQELMKFVRGEGLANVTFLGRITGEVLARSVAECSLVVVPSEWYENCPYSVMESMASAKPVVATDLGGLPELVSDGKTGFIVKSRSPELLADKIAYLMARPDTRKEMGIAAREIALKEFDPQRHYQTIHELYLSLQ